MLQNTMKTKLSITEFNELNNIAPIVECNSDKGKKEVKFKLLDGLQEGFSDKWYNLKKATKEALQYACMRSAEKGFFFFSPDHLNKKFKISITTVYNTFKELINAGKLLRINRMATSHNGKGNAIYIFTEHPNFPVICELLGLDWKADCKADCKAENAENPCGSKVEDDNSAPTYSLPTILPKELKDKENVKHYNVSDDDDSIKLLRDKIEKAEKELAEKPYEKPTVKWHKYVPKEINEKFGYYGSILTDLWRKIKLAERKVNIARLRDIDKIEVAIRVLDNLKKHPRRKQMTLDEMCAYVYKGQLNGLFNLMGNYNLEGMFIDEDYGYYAYLGVYGNHIPTTTDDDDIELENDSSPRSLWWLEEEQEQSTQEPVRYYYGEETPSLDNFPF